MIGRTVLHYKILSPLGSGGMGVVYLAEDERLGRQVALKFLPDNWSREGVALERFRVEARAASALSHPGICAIYDIGTDGDTPFIVMEALKGETLRERIAKGPLAVNDILDIGIQLSDALDAAHGHGIVHRDIKPANIFLGDKNRVKVLDFGLAKLTSTPHVLSSLADTTSVSLPNARDNQMTAPGTAIGTVSYMSPEQARGEDVDARTDLFSLGAVLYEMATGQLAFGGSSAAVAFEAILNRSPQPLARLNPLVPPALEAVVAKALEKERDLRYQHASDLHAELRRIRRDLDVASHVLSHPQLTAAQPAAPSPTASQPAVAAPRRSGFTVAAAIAVLAIAGATSWFWLARDATAPGTAPTPVAESAAVSPAAPSTAPPAAADAQPGATASLPPTEAGQRPAESRPLPAPRPQPTPPADAVAARPAGAGSTATAVPQPPRPAPPAGEVAPVQAAPPPITPAPEPPTSAGTAREGAPAPSTTPPPVTLPPVTSPAVAESAPTPPAPAPAAGRATAQPRPATTPTDGGTQADDEAAIQRVIRTYERAIETKDLALYRSIRPSLTAAEETQLRNSFRQVDVQEITIRVEGLTIDGPKATARLSRQDTLITGGRRQTQNSMQTLRFEKGPAGWVVTN